MGYQLTGAEIYSLAQVAEKDSVYGIGNPFYGQSEEEVNLRLKKASMDLQSKKYISEDFDGSVTISNDLEKMVDACSDFDLMISVETIRDGEYKVGFYFRLDDCWTYLIPLDNDDFELGASSEEDIKGSLIRMAEENPEFVDISDAIMKVDLAQLEYYRGRISDGDTTAVIREISELNNDGELVSIYASAVERKVDYTGVIFTYNENDKDKVGDDILYITSGNRLVAVQYEMIDYVDTVVLRDISKLEIKERIERQLDAFDK